MTAVLGVDLSGPTNVADTAAAWFRATPSELVFRSAAAGLGDPDLLEIATRLAGSGRLVVGLDAPLSYQPGGGDRPADTDLRRKLVERGLPPGTVMPPTLTRMAYLTLRGITLARAIEHATGAAARIVEVHPGAAMALRGAPVAALRAFKRSPSARRRLADWLAGQSVAGLPAPATDHDLAACACALGAWQWDLGRSAWRTAASGSLQPYDFAC